MRVRRLFSLVAAAASLGGVSDPRALGAQADPTAIINRVRVDTRRPIDFHAATFPDTVYVGQQTTHQTAVFLTDNARNRLRRNPEFIPPEFRGLLSYELSAPRRVLPARTPGYEAHVFQRALFPVAEGVLVVPSPQLSYALPASSSYFSREERYTVRAESAHLVVRPLPLDGRPAAFTGAVGVLKVTSRIDTANARVGDPVVFTLRVQGVGNVKLFPRPVIEVDWASAVPATERVMIDSTGMLVRGSKEFDWILTPAREGAVTLPSFTYDFFDPYKRLYDSAVTLPIELEVRAGALAVAEPGESAALMPLRAVVPPSMISRGLPLDTRFSLFAILALALLAPVPAVVLALRRRAPRVQAHVARSGVAGSMETLHTLSFDPANPAAHARSARRALHVALAERLGVAPQVLVSRRQVRRVLRRRGVTRAGTACVIELLEDLDAHGFADASGGTGSVSFAERATQCFAIVDGEAVKRGTGGLPETRDGGVRGLPGTLVLLLALALPVLSLRAQDSGAGANVEVGVLAGDDARAPDAPSPVLVRAATAAYQSRLFTDAAQRFADLVRAHPADAGLLVNWGTAAWAAGDTVNAVIAWHRAARADPLAVDVQERLMMLPSGARGGVAEVPMAPVRFLQLLAITLWLVGWTGAAWLEIRRRRMAGYHVTSHHPTRWTGLLGGAIWICLFGAIAAAGSAAWGRDALDPARLAVVARPETMHIAPGSDSDAMGGVATGDVVQRLEEQGGWERVVHSDGREGWLPAVRLIALVPAADSSAAVPPGVLMELDSARLESVVPR